MTRLLYTILHPVRAFRSRYDVQTYARWYALQSKLKESSKIPYVRK